jgi:hypothetical protein
MSVRLSPATLRSVQSFEDVLSLLSDELDEVAHLLEGGRRLG